MWKTDDTVSSVTKSSCRKTILLSLLQDYKSSVLTFNSEYADPESVHVQLRSCRLDALWRCCRQGFGHSLWSLTTRPIETMTQLFNNFHLWTLRPPEFMWVCDWLHTCCETEFKDDTEASDGRLSSVSVKKILTKMVPKLAGFLLLPPPPTLGQEGGLRLEDYSIKVRPEPYSVAVVLKEQFDILGNKLICFLAMETGFPS